MANKGPYASNVVVNNGSFDANIARQSTIAKSAVENGIASMMVAVQRRGEQTPCAVHVALLPV